jgi:hypothetical protein
MGNALVVGIVAAIGRALAARVTTSSEPPLNRHVANICDRGAIHPARLAHFAEAQQKTCFTGSSSEPAVMDNIIYAKD